MKEIADEMKKYFRERYSQHGATVRSLWGSYYTQAKRFEVLSEMGDFNSRRVLDVGCGFGDFYGYMVHKRSILLSRYVGVDVTPEMIAVASEKYPEAEFFCEDFLQFSPVRGFDYCVASGIFFLSRDWERYFLEVCKKMLWFSDVGIGVNVLSVFGVSGREPAVHHGSHGESCRVDPGRALTLVMDNLSRHVVLRHDYIDNDFTLYIYKEQNRR